MDKTSMLASAISSHEKTRFIKVVLPGKFWKL